MDNVLHVIYVQIILYYHVCFFTVCAQPSIDASGNIIPHSILGTVEDFKFEARKHDNFEVSPTVCTLNIKTTERYFSFSGTPQTQVQYLLCCGTGCFHFWRVHLNC